MKVRSYYCDGCDCRSSTSSYSNSEECGFDPCEGEECWFEEVDAPIGWNQEVDGPSGCGYWHCCDKCGNNCTIEDDTSGC